MADLYNKILLQFPLYKYICRMTLFNKQFLFCYVCCSDDTIQTKSTVMIFAIVWKEIIEK